MNSLDVTLAGATSSPASVTTEASDIKVFGQCWVDPFERRRDITNLWIREMSGADAALGALDVGGRLRIMAEAVDFVLYRADFPLQPRISPDATRLIGSAIDIARALDVPFLRVEELLGEIGARIGEEPPVASILLSAAMDMTAGLIEEPTSSEVGNVLFFCYDATMHSQGFGHIITIEDQEGNPACRDVIRRQKEQLAIPERSTRWGVGGQRRGGL